MFHYVLVHDLLHVRHRMAWRWMHGAASSCIHHASSWEGGRRNEHMWHLNNRLFKISYGAREPVLWLSREHGSAWAVVQENALVDKVTPLTDRAEAHCAEACLLTLALSIVLLFFNYA